MSKLQLPGRIDESGKIEVFDKIAMSKWMAGNAGKNIAISIEVRGRKRTNPQNSYYWKIVVPLVQQAMNSFGNDFDKDEVHEFLKKEFNWEDKEMKEGMYVRVPRSTTKLSTTEFSDYKEKIQQFAAEVLGVYVPDPNEQLEFEMNKDTQSKINN
jgi:hypothetical protein